MFDYLIKLFYLQIAYVAIQLKVGSEEIYLLPKTNPTVVGRVMWHKTDSVLDFSDPSTIFKRNWFRVAAALALATGDKHKSGNKSATSFYTNKTQNL